MVRYTGEPVRTDEESYALIQKIYEEATAGADFSPVKEYNEDTAMNPDEGYYITHDEVFEAFDEAAFTLRKMK